MTSPFKRNVLCFAAFVLAVTSSTDMASAAFINASTGVATYVGGKSSGQYSSIDKAINNLSAAHAVGVINPNAYPIAPNGPYRPVSGANWVTSSFTTSGANGVTPDRNLDRSFDGFYAYRTSFALASAEEIFFDVKLRSDNNLVAVYVNSTSFTSFLDNVALPTANESFKSTNPVSLKWFSNASTNIGVNSLTFVVRNIKLASGDNPQALIANVIITNSLGSTAIVPVPAAAVLFAVGLPFLGLIRRRHG